VIDMGVVRSVLLDAYDEAPPLPGQDPWLVAFEGGHLLVQSARRDRRIVVRRVHDVDRMEVGPPRTIWAPSPWRARRGLRHDRQLWAPELHEIDGRWYLYVAASDGIDAHHRCYAHVADSPFGPFEEVGWMGDVAHDFWAIDLTVLEHAGRRYAMWSGVEGRDDHAAQHLYIAPMLDPVTVSAPRVRIASPDLPWEHSVAGINEGPQVLRRPDGHTFVLFSANASWSTAYSTGVMELVGADPLDPAAWRKHGDPLLVGGGHGCAIETPGGLRFVHHRKTGSEPGWSDRVIVAAPLDWDRRGIPVIAGGTTMQPARPDRTPGMGASLAG
jgi:GH43 family beta-xylosidase